MSDPVMLPSSRKIVNRTTIARHLLRFELKISFSCQIKRIFSIENSDQTDPFNRNPLRMQDVIPQKELKRTIEQWKASQRG